MVGGTPLALVCSLASVRTAHDRGFAVAALVVSGLEALLLAGLIAMMLLMAVLG